MKFFARSEFRGFVRRWLSQAARWVLRRRSQPYPIEQDTTALIFVPHPDDEALGCGGLVLLKRMEGLTVRIAFVTDGCASHPGHPVLTPEAIAAERQREAFRAAARLGVERAGLDFLGVGDGTLARLDAAAAEEVVGKIAHLLRQTKPDEIFLPCRQDGSSEHDATFILVSRALEQVGQQPRIFEFPVWSWWNPLRLTRTVTTGCHIWRVNFRGYESQKQRAIAAYATQIQPTPPWTQPLLSREFVSFFSTDEEFFFER